MTAKKARKVATKKLSRKPAVKKTGAVAKFKLRNGLSVLLLENHKSPVVSVQMWVKTGSADEQKGEEGISHFIEHLVFKGTERYGVGEIASTVEASGGELNAYTSFDQTVFYVNISKEFSDVALDVISQMMGFPKFEGAEIDNEREVVIEEIKRGNDSPGRQASRLLFSTVYKSHPYGIPVIGYDKIIKKVSRKTLVDYYQSRYIPTNMQLVIAGDFSATEMRKQVDGQFGRVKSFKLRKVSRKTEAKQKSPRIKVEKAPFEEAQFHLAWRVPGAAHKDIAALDVLALILGQGESSRLSQEMRMKAPLTNSIGAGTFTPKDGGLFTVSGSLNVDQSAVAMKALKTELLRIVSEPVTQEELRKAVINLESEEFYAMETIEGVARKAGSLENLMGDYKYFEKFLKQIQALTPEDIQRVARLYLAPVALNIVMMAPRHEKELATSWKTWLKEYGKEFAVAKKQKSAKVKKSTAKKSKWAMSAGQPPSEIERHTLTSGAKILFREDSATPVFSAKAAFLGGMRVENENEGGLTELVSRVWTSGTKNLSEADIQSKIENMAGGLSAFGGRNSAGLSLQTIAPFENDSLDLFNEVLTGPVIPESAVEREKVIMLEAIRSRDDSPGQLVSQLFSHTMFRGHPYSRDMYGTRESVQGLKTGDTVSYLARLNSASNLTIAVAGNINRTLWIDRLEAATAHLPKKTMVQKRFEHKGPTKNEKAFKQLEREQTHIIIGYKGLTLDDPRRYALQVMQSILAGQGGRLFLELRDKASLAYSVSPMRMEGLETGYFGGYIGCSPEKGEKAIEMLKIEFNKLVETAVPAAELDRAKRYLIGRHDIDLQRNSAICSSMLFNEIYGIPAEEMFEYSKHLQSVTSEDIRKIAAEIFAEPEILCAVGPKQPWK